MSCVFSFLSCGPYLSWTEQVLRLRLQFQLCIPVYLSSPAQVMQIRLHVFVDGMSWEIVVFPWQNARRYLPMQYSCSDAVYCKCCCVCSMFGFYSRLVVIARNVLLKTLFWLGNLLHTLRGRGRPAVQYSQLLTLCRSFYTAHLVGAVVQSTTLARLPKQWQLAWLPSTHTNGPTDKTSMACNSFCCFHSDLYVCQRTSTTLRW